MLGNTLNYKVVKRKFGNPFKERENSLLFSSLLKPLRATTFISVLQLKEIYQIPVPIAEDEEISRRKNAVLVRSHLCN